MVTRQAMAAAKASANRRKTLEVLLDANHRLANRVMELEDALQRIVDKPSNPQNWEIAHNALNRK